MLIPVPEADEPARPSFPFLPSPPASVPRADAAWPGQAGDPGIGALLRFRSLMASDGQHVDLARLCRDRFYAYERIAAAHASGHEPLRRLALELFQIHHRCAAGLPAQ
jgi:hypothetical protein